MDSDDIWVADKIESQLKIMRDYPEYDVIYGDIELMNEQGNTVATPKVDRYSGLITEKLLFDNFVTNVTVMFRRKCYEELGGLDENLYRSDDYDLYLRYSVRYRFFYFKKVLARVRVLTNQLSSNKKDRMAVNKYILHRFIKNNENIITKTLAQKGLHHLYVRSARVNTINGAYREGLYDFTKAIRYYPTNISSFIPYMKAVILKR